MEKSKLSQSRMKLKLFNDSYDLTIDPAERDVLDVLEKSLPDTPIDITLGKLQEPTGHPEFIEILEYLGDNGHKLRYHTSGAIIGRNTDPRATDILEATKKYCSQVILEYNPGKILDNASLALKEIGIPSALHIKVSNENIQELRGLDYPAVILSRAMDINQKSKVSQEEWEKIKSEILKYEELKLPEHMWIKKGKLILTKNIYELWKKI